MTEKKERIQEAALQLFARQGYAATSTSKVAREAGVSEGLIFRHFSNKEGLLRALLEEGKERIKQYFANIILEEDPKKLLRKSIDLPFQIVAREKEFWRLQKSLKLQHPDLYHSLDMSSTDALLHAVTQAFEKMGYQDPGKEAVYLSVLLEGVALGLLLGDLRNPDDLQAFIRNKYEL
jgi:AcrR family transcriptional regulator